MWSIFQSWNNLTYWQYWKRKGSGLISSLGWDKIPEPHGPVMSFAIIQGSFPCSNKEMTSGLEMESPSETKLPKFSKVTSLYKSLWVGSRHFHSSWENSTATSLNVTNPWAMAFRNTWPAQISLGSSLGQIQSPSASPWSRPGPSGANDLARTSRRKVGSLWTLGNVVLTSQTKWHLRTSKSELGTFDTAREVSRGNLRPKPPTGLELIFF